MAIRWALSQEGVVTGLVGPSTIAHLEDDAGASDLEIAPDTELALNACVAAEEERLREALRAEIIAILNRPITALEQVPQLVYALEGSADLELAPEEDLIGHFKRVIPVMQGAAEPSGLEEVRESLRRQIGAR
jgi:hypothetical protein